MAKDYNPNCPRCGHFRNEIENGMIEECKFCGFQECPLCGDGLTKDRFCLRCLGHMTESSFHSVGMCPDCNISYFTELKNALSKYKNFDIDTEKEIQEHIDEYIDNVPEKEIEKDIDDVLKS